MEYVCKIGTPTGEVVERTFRATDEAELRVELERQGLYLFQIKKGLGQISFRKRKVPPAGVLIFAQELAALLKAGLPLVQSL
jgi:type IV pilus assembly protein PilC